MFLWVNSFFNQRLFESENVKKKLLMITKDWIFKIKGQI